MNFSGRNYNFIEVKGMASQTLTEGKVFPTLIKFTIPLLISVIFQQLYNIADSIIVGQFLGEAAFAAVSNSTEITYIYLSFAMAANIAVSVLVSQFFGAKMYRELKTTTTTVMLFCLGLCIILSAAGIVFLNQILSLINTPSEIFNDCKSYLYIYIGGYVTLMFYNICNGLYTAMGDSKTPLYFLIMSSVVNIGLDVWFVGFMPFGVAGAAAATIIAQGLACILSFILILKRINSLDFGGKKASLFSGKLLKKFIGIAIPSAIQQLSVSVGNIFIQSRINLFGKAAIAGFGGATKLNSFTLFCLGAPTNSLSAFVAQNIGAGRLDRVKKGLNAALLICFSIGVFFALAYIIFANRLIPLLIDNPSGAAMEAGVSFLRTVCPFYLIISAKFSFDGVFRGAGYMFPYMLATSTDLVLRVILAFIFADLFGVTGVWWAWPFGWTAAVIIIFVFYISGSWKKHQLI